MPFSKLVIMLPCHGLEDFPVHVRGSDADSLLAAWTSLWHPHLIANTGRRPVFQPCHQTEFELSRALIVVPTIAQNKLPIGFAQSTQDQNCTVINGQLTRQEILASALSQLDPPPPVEARFVRDFLALGFAYLQVQLMTRQVRYSSTLDEARFEQTLVQAANSVVSGDDNTVKSQLAACFDLLLEEKNRYYPVVPKLVDYVLLAESLVGPQLVEQLKCGHKVNLLMTGELADKIRCHYPEINAALLDALAAGRVSLVGGLLAELPSPLLSTETLINGLIEGRRCYAAALGAEPKIFGRRTFGLTTILPSVLQQLGFEAAVHATLDDGQFPLGSTTNIRWESPDGRTIAALAQVPLDAGLSQSLIDLGITIGQSLDSAHNSTIVLAHWPGRVAESFADLEVVHRYGNLFGDFVTLDHYADSVYDPGYSDSFGGDQYRSPYLKQAVDRGLLNPISRFVDYWRRSYLISAARTLNVMAMLYGDNMNAAAITHERLDRLQLRIEAATCTNDVENLEADIGQLVDEILQSLATVWHKETAAPQRGANVQRPLRLLVNPTSGTSRKYFRSNAARRGPVKAAPPVFIGDHHERISECVVDIPAMGMAVVQSSAGVGQITQSKKEPPLLDTPTTHRPAHLLRNEYFEVEIDPRSGGVRGLHVYGRRNNLLTQKLALRIAQQNDAEGRRLIQPRYSQMIAEAISVLDNSRVSAAVVSTGRLEDGGQAVARYQQTLRVTRGIRIFDIEIQLDPLVPLTGRAWQNYFCSRVAWYDESAELVRSLHEIRETVIGEHVEAPQFIEIDDGTSKVTLFTGGLPFHRRSARRMLDTLLIVGNERQRRFVLGVGVNVAYALRAAVQRMSPAWEVQVPSASAIQTGWLFHINSKNVLATRWEPSMNEEGRLVGVRIRLQETEGRSGKLSISCPRELTSADRVNLLGDKISSGKVEGSTATFDFQARQFFQVELNWNQ